MDAIKAITNRDVYNQCHHCEEPKHSQDKPLNHDKEGHGNQPQSHKAALPTNAMRASWEHRESMVRALWVSRQYSSCDDNYHHRSVNPHGASATNARRSHSTQETSGRLGKLMPQISRDELGINNKTYKKELASKTKKTWSHHDTYTTGHARPSLDKPQIELLGRASDTVPSDNRTSASNNIKNYHFFST